MLPLVVTIALRTILATCWCSGRQPIYDGGPRVTKDDDLRQLAGVGAVGRAAADFLQRSRMSPATHRAYYAVLRQLAKDHPNHELAHFNPPHGVEVVREFLARHWGGKADATVNGKLSALHGFFTWQMEHGRMIADPTHAIRRRRLPMPKRDIFLNAEVEKIFAANSDPRDRLALRLLLDWGLSKGGLKNLRFQHFDSDRRRLVARAYGGRQYSLPIPDEGLWTDLEELRRENPESTRQSHYLLPYQMIKHEKVTAFDPEVPRGERGLHKWWYRCLARAGIVKPGIENGHGMKKARQTAGQRWLDRTKSIKTVQAVLGHASVGTTWTGYSAPVEIGKLADELSKGLEDQR
jgi:integrase